MDYPEIIQEVGFDFRWDNHKVWALDIPVTEMETDELTWHLDVPFLSEHRPYDITPQAVMDHPAEHKDEYERMLKAELSHPIDIMENKGRWLILDGLHRLMKAALLEHRTVRVRIIPRSMIPDIVKE